jgi:outer membrane protein assembly factor BamB
MHGKIPYNKFQGSKTLKKLTATTVLLLSITITAHSLPTSQDWPQFRGPNGSGVKETSGLPAQFGPDTNVIWKKAIPTGYSSPVLTENSIFLTSCESDKLITYCLDRKTGDIRWGKEAPRTQITKIDFRNNPASPSPVVDDRHVYVFFPDFGLLAYDFAGSEVWRLPLGPYDNVYGMGASPILADDNVILVCDQNLGSYILAVNKTNGRVSWKTERPEAKSGHSTPIIFQPAQGDTQILTSGSFLLTAYSAKTGGKIWWAGGLSFEMKSTPVMSDGILFINGYASPLNQPGNQVEIPAFEEALSKFDKNGDKKLSQEELPEDPVYEFFSFMDLAHDGFLGAEDWAYFRAGLASLNGMLAIRIGGRGDVTDTNTLWEYRRSVPQLPSPLIYKNVLYMLNDGGYVTTFKPESGEVIAQGRLRGAGGKFFASPVAADNKIFLTSLRGKISVLKPGGGLDIAALSDLNEDCYATPAIGNGRIYIRTVKTLYCFGQEE